jgi:hypothetical protein
MHHIRVMGEMVAGSALPEDAPKLNIVLTSLVLATIAVPMDAPKVPKERNRHDRIHTWFYKLRD